MPMMCGGTGPVKEADDKIQELCDGVKSHVENEAKKSYDTFVAKNYTTQCVAGTNYFVKVHVGEAEHIHICIHKKLPCNGGEVLFLKMEGGKTAEDAIGYF
ncbi:cystatin-B-like [Halichoeres trimaculatus]|uniref:cystatin-B-like n=1 Tax=Halichoeres trimaculatus TaxID=147232 RepID=UPI003D9FA48F